MKTRLGICMLITLFLLLMFTPSDSIAAGKMPEGTMVANVGVSNKSSSEIKQALETEIAIWQAQDDIILRGEFEKIYLPKDVFLFDVDKTMKQLDEHTKRSPLKFFQRPKNVQIPFFVEIKEEHDAIKQLQEKSYIDYEDVKDKLLLAASQLDNAELSLIYMDDVAIPLEKIAEMEMDIPELSEATLMYIINELDGYTIAPNDFFSFLKAINTPDKLINSTEEVSFVGTGLYTLFLQSNVEIVERHAQLTLPDYGERGINVFIHQKDKKDLIVKNINDVALKIEVNRKEGKLHLALKGNLPNYRYEFKVENEKEIKPRTLYRYSKKLKPGEEQIIQAGKNGVKIDVYRSIFEKNIFLESELISKELYLPSPKIVLVSTETVVPEEDLVVGGNGVEEKDDDSELLETGDSSLDNELGEYFTLGNDEAPKQVKEIETLLAEFEKQLKELQKQLVKIPMKKEEEFIKNQTEMSKQLIDVEKQLQEMMEQLIEQGLFEKDGDGK